MFSLASSTKSKASFFGAKLKLLGFTENLAGLLT